MSEVGCDKAGVLGALHYVVHMHACAGSSVCSTSDSRFITRTRVRVSIFHCSTRYTRNTRAQQRSLNRAPHSFKPEMRPTTDEPTMEHEMLFEKTRKRFKSWVKQGGHTPLKAPFGAFSPFDDTGPFSSFFTRHNIFGCPKMGNPRK